VAENLVPQLQDELFFYLPLQALLLSKILKDVFACCQIVPLQIR